jgi:uncharacterized delta-60 repeat protein
MLLPNVLSNIPRYGINLIVLSSLIIAGCGGGGSGSTCNSYPAPQITSIPPTSSTVGEQYLYQVVSRFSCLLGMCKGIEGLQLPSGAVISSDVITWTPGQELVNKDIPFAITTYPDLFGCRATQSWSVRVSPTPIIPDTVPPYVTLTSPVNGTTNVPVSTTIAVTFSEPIDPLYVDTSSILVTSTSGSVAGRVLVSGTTATFTPSNNLSYQSTYTVKITANVKDLAGNSMLSDYIWTFTTGRLDATFGIGGKVTTPLGSGNGMQAQAVAIQSDGKIVAVGYSSGANTDFVLVRYNSDGSLDATFGLGGIVTTPIGSGVDAAYAVAIQVDKKIVVAGYTSNSASGTDFALARYNIDGSLDTTFNGNGKVITDIGGGNDIAYAVAIQSDGKIVAAGFSKPGYLNDNFALVRYNTDGSLDNTFGAFGIVTIDVGHGHVDEANSIAIQSDGKIIAAGFSYNYSNYYGGNVFALARFNPNGSLDSSFGGSGIVTTEIGNSSNLTNQLNDRISAVAVQGDGKIVATGYSNDYFSSCGGNVFALARYNPDGSLDNSFGGSGKVTTEIGRWDSGGCYHHISYAYAQAIQSDGNIIAAGYSYDHINDNTDFAFVRYHTDGSLDDTFGDSGKFTTPIGDGADQAYAVTIQGEGKIVAAGFAIVNSNYDIALVRLVP